MRRVGVVVSACLATVLALRQDALAADLDPQEPRSEYLLLFSGTELWRGGGFGHGGLLWSPGGLDREGFTLKTLVGGGGYRYSSGTSLVIGRQWLIAAMPGWRFKTGTLETTVFAGPDYQRHDLTPDDSSNRRRGSHIGLRAGADLWWQPTPDSMANASISLSTIGNSYWTRIAAGRRVLDLLYVGPEVTACGGDGDRQLRIGLHATALRIGRYEWSAGIGWVRDADERDGLYGRIGVLTRH